MILNAGQLVTRSERKLTLLHWYTIFKVGGVEDYIMQL